MLQKIKLLVLNQMPRSLPDSEESYEPWVLRILKNGDLPDTLHVRHFLVTNLMHLPDATYVKKDAYFIAVARKSLVNGFAFSKLKDLAAEDKAKRNDLLEHTKV